MKTRSIVSKAYFPSERLHDTLLLLKKKGWRGFSPTIATATTATCFVLVLVDNMKDTCLSMENVGSKLKIEKSCLTSTYGNASRCSCVGWRFFLAAKMEACLR